MRPKTVPENQERRLRSLRINRSSNAFTLVEMLVVVGMLAILMGTAFSGLGQARNQARVAKANAEVRELMNAWLSYESAYDNWPVQISGNSLDATSENLKELLGQNDQSLVYLNAQMVNGAFRDPWGTPYRFQLVPATAENKETEKFVASVTFPNRQRMPR